MFIHVKFCRNYRAAGDMHKTIAEWPPSPYRLVCALVHAFYKKQRITGIKDDYNALNKLTSLPPPCILTSCRNNKHNISVYVKSNAPDQKDDKKEVHNYLNNANNILRHYPFVATEDVFFYWPGAECIRLLLPYISHLGTASSLVEVSEQIPPNKEFYIWEPNDNGKHTLRCHYPGIIKDLDIMHETNGQKDKQVYPLNIRYSCRKAIMKDGIMPEKATQANFFETCRIFGIETSLNLNIFQVSRLAESLRNAIGSMANKLGLKQFEKEVFSHDPKTHISYVPLPYVFGQMPSGDIKGVMVCLPKALIEFREDLENCLYNLNKVPFYCDKKFIGDVTLCRPRDLVSLNTESWCCKNKYWSSAVPLECLFFKGNKEKQKMMLTEWCNKECSYYGLPTPVSVNFTPVSFWGHRARSFVYIQRTSTNFKTKSFFAHLNIQFPIMVEGPILLGRGRNFGTGLMVPR